MRSLETRLKRLEEVPEMAHIPMIVFIPDNGRDPDIPRESGSQIRIYDVKTLQSER